MSETTNTSANEPSKADVRAYNHAVTSGKKLALSQGKSSWALGDLASTIPAIYGAGTVQRFADEIGMPYKTILAYRQTAEAFAASDRSELNGFTIHAIFKGEDDRVALVAEKTWTVAEARAEIARRNAPEPADDDTDGDDTSETETPEVDQRAELVRKVEQARVNLLNAEAALAAYDAEHAAPAPVITIGLHTGIRGVPEHNASEPRSDCPVCSAANRDSSRPSSRTVRKSRASRAAGKAAADQNAA
jgi:hypothetical protein